MSVEQVVIRKLRLLPPEKQQQVLDFMESLAHQPLDAVSEKQECRFLSESALQKDWLGPEEEAAWQDL
jgi:hypothetical protein